MGGPARTACGPHTAMRSLSGALPYRPSRKGAVCHYPLGDQRRDGHGGRDSPGGEHGHPPDRPALRQSCHQLGRGSGRGGPCGGPGDPAGFRVHPGPEVAPPPRRSPAPGGGVRRAGPGPGAGAETDERVFAGWPDRRSARRAHARLRGRRGPIPRLRRCAGGHASPGVPRCSGGGVPAADGGRRSSRQAERGAARGEAHGDRATTARVSGRSAPGPGGGRRWGAAGSDRSAAPAAQVIPGADEASRGVPAARRVPAPRDPGRPSRLPARRDPGRPSRLPARRDPGRRSRLPAPRGPGRPSRLPVPGRPAASRGSAAAPGCDGAAREPCT
jgi:hypothetical protein